MYIVNTSFMVEPEVHGIFLESIRKYYVPLLADQGFTRVTFTRMIPTVAEPHFTYSLQVEAENLTDYRRLTEELFGEYQLTAKKLFHDQVLWFVTLLKRVDL